jgi:UDP-N-acetylglucosamine acyltransferase
VRGTQNAESSESSSADPQRIRTMPEVHPTARIDPQARLADDAAVGPHCRVEGPVRLGPGVRLLHRVVLRGTVHVGANVRIYPNAAVGSSSADADADHNGGSVENEAASASAPDTASEDDPDRPAVIVGEGAIVREGVRLDPGTAESPTRVGEEAYLMVNCQIGRGVVIGARSTIVNGVRLDDAAQVGEHALLGGNASLGPRCRVGRLGMVSGGAELNRDVPPFCTAYNTDCVGSLNLVGLRRTVDRAHIRPLRRAFDLLYRRNPDGDPVQVLDGVERELAEDPLCAELTAFIRASRRGIAPYGSGAPEDVS